MCKNNQEPPCNTQGAWVYRWRPGVRRYCTHSRHFDARFRPPALRAPGSDHFIGFRTFRTIGEREHPQGVSNRPVCLWAPGSLREKEKKKERKKSISLCRTAARAPNSNGTIPANLALAAYIESQLPIPSCQFKKVNTSLTYSLSHPVTPSLYRFTLAGQWSSLVRSCPYVRGYSSPYLLN